MKQTLSHRGQGVTETWLGAGDTAGFRDPKLGMGNHESPRKRIKHLSDLDGTARRIGNFRCVRAV
jgi:hypothetical protein